MKIFKQFTPATGFHKTGMFIRSIGHYFIKEAEPDKLAMFCEIFWCRAGSATFYDENGNTHTLKKDMVWYYPPGSLHKIRPDKNGIDYRWLTFEGADAAMLFHTLRIKPGLNQACKCPDSLFASVELNLHDPDILHQMQALSIGFEILTKLVAPEHHIPRIAEQAKEIIRTNYHQSDLNVEMIAEELHIHRVSLSRMFTNVLGISPVKYLSQTRMRAAIDLLTSTGLTVKEIALQCGFATDGYFVKIFRKQMKMTPREFRLLYGKNTTLG